MARATRVAEALSAFQEREARRVERQVADALRCLLNATGAEVMALSDETGDRIALINGTSLRRTGEWGWVIEPAADGANDAR